jgi:hypothetical protein
MHTTSGFQGEQNLQSMITLGGYRWELLRATVSIAELREKIETDIETDTQ